MAKREKKAKDPNKKGFLQGFKDFISKGSVIDLAVAVIIGGAFGAIVNSMVKDIIMPPIALLFGDRGFEHLYWVMKGADPMSEAVVSGAEAPGVVMYYGNFIQTIINFLIIAFFIYVVFIVIIKGAQKRVEEKRLAEEAASKSAEEEIPAEPEIPQDILLLTEIRDQLRDLNKGNK